MKPEIFVQKNIDWLGHASFRIRGSTSTIYIDPWKVKDPLPADIICITHNHFDHFSKDDIEKIRKATTVIFGPPECKANYEDTFRHFKPGQKEILDDIVVEGVPAYNIEKNFHPKEKNWLGYIITVDGIRIYHSGDTDKIPEMAEIKTDIALLPVGGTYTMTPDQAAEAAALIKPKIAIPMHYGDVVGTLADLKGFEKIASVKVMVLKPF